MDECDLCQRDCKHLMVFFSRSRSKVDLKPIARTFKTKFTGYTEVYWLHDRGSLNENWEELNPSKPERKSSLSQAINDSN